MEYIEIVDQNNTPTGEVVEKNIVHMNPLYYREVICLMVNQNKELLLQKRASTKKEKANKWEFCGGHIAAREKPKQAIIREIAEETGMEIMPDELYPIGIYPIQEKIEERYHYVFSYVYAIKIDKKVEEIKLQPQEVSMAKYYTFEQVEKMLSSQDENCAFLFNHIPQVLEKVKKVGEATWKK